MMVSSLTDRGFSMNKNAIQKYAIWARNELIEQTKQRAYQYGISDKGYSDINASIINGRVLSEDEKRQRIDFIDLVKNVGYQQAVEEVAYTWFNRFIALRYMEVNDYLTTHIRVFSDANGVFKPEILKEVLHLDIPLLDKKKVSELVNASADDDLYRYLLLTQCNALNEALPEMFERMGSYTELLLPNNILRQGSVIERLVTNIPEEDWKDTVQIIGWMYQYYNTEPKQAVFDGLKKNVKITKEKIPAATQLFTPDWIVRYMVENSLGRLWLEGHPNDELKVNWKYYLDEAEQPPEVTAQLEKIRSEHRNISPEDIKIIDPCMGSGHILVYIFDVLMQIYRSAGYADRDATKLIIEKNIYGLDIDRRAYQLAYFTLMMKARQYNRRIFTENIKPQVYHPTGFIDGEEYGSLLKIDELGEMPKPKEGQLELFDKNYETILREYNFKRLLSQKYDVVCTNPPYMSRSGMNGNLSYFVKDNYPDSKSDLFAVFIEQCCTLIKPNAYQAMITQHAWMFLSSYELLRNKLIYHNIVNMAHLGARAFAEIGGEVVQSTVFIIQNSRIDGYKGCYVRLVDIDDATEKEREFLNGTNRYVVSSGNFTKIPGSPVAYWVSEAMLKVFEKGEALNKLAEPRVGLQTGDNDRFLRLWYEVATGRIGFTCTSIEESVKSGRKWFPYNKGGEFRKWYGNNDYVVNWENDGIEIRDFKDKTGYIRSRAQNTQYYFKQSVTWSKISSGGIAFRLKPIGHIFDVAGTSIFSSEQTLKYLLSFCNSAVALQIANVLSPTLNYEVGHVACFPVIEKHVDKVSALVEQNIYLSKGDWDSFETSWDFRCHPLICGEYTVAKAFSKWKCKCDKRFNNLKANEEELNCLFIEVYGLQGELTSEVKVKDVTVRRADLGRDIRSLISYVVGCMFGRYSLGIEGLVYAGDEWDASKYKLFVPDKSNIIPICDDEYFDDDIVGRFIDFVRTVYGAETLEENLKYIADALGGKGTAREVIRNYFLNDFYKDHCKIYQKRPIYWLFDSGQKNGFKALMYMHRYSRDLLAMLRTDYVHEQQERYRTQLRHIRDALNHAKSADYARLSKQQNKLTEQVQELVVFEEKVHHLADKRIEIDLDDGVKHNYALFADVLAKI